MLYSGCKVVREPRQEPICEVTPDSTLSVWVRVPACDSVRLEEKGQVLAPDRLPVLEGCQLKVPMSGISTIPGSTLVLRNAQTGQSLWTLKLDRARPELFQLSERIRQRAAVDLEDFITSLNNKRLQRHDLLSLGELSFATAFVYMRLGQFDLCVNQYRHAIEYYLRSGYLSNAIDAAQKLAYNLQRADMFAEARQTLWDAEGYLPTGYADSYFWLSYQTGMIYRHEGQLTEAAGWFLRAYQDATKVGNRLLMGTSSSMLADVYVAMDRPGEAEQLLGAMSQIVDGERDCEKASLLAGTAWTGLLMAEDSNAHPAIARVGTDSIRELFERALESRKKCVDNAGFANILNGLAQTAFLEGRLVEARTFMEQARQVPALSALGSLELLELEARLALSNNQPEEAADLFKKLGELARHTPRRIFTCKASTGLLEAQRARGVSDREVADSVKTCLDAGSSGLGKLEIRTLGRRARAAGLLP